MVKEVKAGMFCRVQDSTFAEHGVKKNDVIYLAGDTFVRQTEDPYQFRKVFIGAFLEDDIVQANKKPFLIDGKRLKPVSKAFQEKLEGLLKEAYEPKEEALVEAAD